MDASACGKKVVSQGANGPKFVCSVCSKVYSHKRTLNAHQKSSGHVSSSKELVPSRSFTCSECGASYSQLKNLWRHEKTKLHVQSTIQAAEKKNLVLCKELNCSKVIRSVKDLISHLSKEHQVQLDYTEVKFSTEDDFVLWKESLEKKTESSFIRTCGKHKYLDHEVMYLYCNRSGRSRTKTEPDRVRLTSKVDSYCTCHMVVRKNRSSGVLTVWYCSNHYGHDINLDKTRLSESDKKFVICRLREGLTAKQIVDCVRSQKLTFFQRIQLLNVHDVHNIAKSMGLQLIQRQKHDSTSLQINEIFQHHAVTSPDTPENELKRELKNLCIEIASQIDTIFNDESLLNARRHLLTASNLLKFTAIPADVECEDSSPANKGPTLQRCRVFSRKVKAAISPMLSAPTAILHGSAEHDYASSAYAASLIDAPDQSENDSDSVKGLRTDYL